MSEQKQPYLVDADLRLAGSGPDEDTEYTWPAALDQLHRQAYSTEPPSLWTDDIIRRLDALEEDVRQLKTLLHKHLNGVSE